MIIVENFTNTLSCLFDSRLIDGINGLICFSLNIVSRHFIISISNSEIRFNRMMHLLEMCS